MRRTRALYSGVRREARQAMGLPTLTSVSDIEKTYKWDFWVLHMLLLEVGLSLPSGGEHVHSVDGEKAI